MGKRRRRALKAKWSGPIDGIRIGRGLAAVRQLDHFGALSLRSLAVD